MRSRMLLIGFFGIFIGIAAYLINIVSNSVIANGVDAIELRQAHADMTQLYSLLGAATLRLKQHAYDWSTWDEAYEYVANRNEDFIASDMSMDRFQELHITGAAFYDMSAARISFLDRSRLIFGEEWVARESDVFDSVVNMVHDSDLDSYEGFINVNDVAMLVVVHKITDSSGRKPARGYLLMASALDVYFKEKAHSISGLLFNVLPLSAFDGVDASKAYWDNFKLLQTSNEVRVYSVINDIFGYPSFCLELRKPRDIAVFGRQISQKNFWLMLALCFAVLGAGLGMLHLAQKRFMRDVMRYRARHDRVTGLPNTLSLQERLPEVLKSALNDGVSLGLLYIDVDNFKSINDSYGYQQGDVVLCELAKRLLEFCPDGRVVRSSVDNFQIAITAANDSLVLAKAQAIQAAMSKTLLLKGNELHLTASSGLAFLNADCANSAELVHRAELAMVDAKQKGGNRLSLFEDSMALAASGRRQMETALYEAVEHNGLTVYYQPKVDISKNEVAGCEALVRWQTSDGKWVPPPAFIPIAEETDLVVRIDMFVLRRACRQAVAWQQEGISVPIAVNMSVRSILSEDFADQVLRIMDEEGTPPSLVDIEITETSLMSDMDKAFAAISRLHEAGIHIALDDFGTGFSSLQYLSAMPISFLKIDRKFVDDIFSGKVTAQPLIKSIIALAANLGMQTICEGVENRDQLAYLLGNGAHVIQGYLFSKPLNSTDCGDYLRNREARIAAVMAA